MATVAKTAYDPLATEGERRRDLRAALYGRLRAVAEKTVAGAPPSASAPLEELRRVLADLKALDGSIE